jgi:hypothetical protein
MEAHGYSEVELGSQRIEAHGYIEVELGSRRTEAHGCSEVVWQLLRVTGCQAALSCPTSGHFVVISGYFGSLFQPLISH